MTGFLNETMKSAKKINRRMVVYAQDRASSSGVRFVEALQWMRDNAATVAKDVGVSEAFVKLWTKDDLRKSILRKES